jgi:hypothetical protein
LKVAFLANVLVIMWSEVDNKKGAALDTCIQCSNLIPSHTIMASINHDYIMKIPHLFPAVLAGVELEAFNRLSNLGLPLNEILVAKNGTDSFGVRSLFVRQVQCPATYPQRCPNGSCCQAAATCVNHFLTMALF